MLELKAKLDEIPVGTTPDGGRIPSVKLGTLKVALEVKTGKEEVLAPAMSSMVEAPVGSAPFGGKMPLAVEEAPLGTALEGGKIPLAMLVDEENPRDEVVRTGPLMQV